MWAEDAAGSARALGQVTTDITVAGIASDRLYPLELQEEIGRLLPGERPVAVVQSDFGHDGFLIETEQIGTVIATALTT